jgi:sirohydrochlorin cobaltochelatase
MSENTAPPAIILFAHGARDPQWALPFTKIQRCVESRLPDTAVELAFLELMDPPLSVAVERLVAGGHARIVIAPLFMAQGGHLKHDLPKIVDALRARHPGVSVSLLPPIGEVDAILEAISAWLVSAATHQALNSKP